MILTGPEIRRQVEAGRITISPFEEGQLNPNSYDFRLGSTLVQYVDNTLDSRAKNETTSVEVADSGVILVPGKIHLMSTFETMGSEHYVPIIRAKSSIARLGLFVHVTADLIDIGSINRWTLQLHAVQPVVVYPGMRIGQVTFWQTMGDKVLYTGKYQGSTGPVASMSYLDSDGNS